MPNPTINPKDLTPGRVVTVRARIGAIDVAGDLQLAFKSYTVGEVFAHVAPSEILSVEPREFKVGDRVRWGKHAKFTRVIWAIRGPLAWVSCGGGSDGATCFLSDLTHADEGDA